MADHVMQRRRPSTEILSGESADVYFARAEEILRREGLDPLVSMEVFARQDAVLCGIDEAKILLAHALEGADPAEVSVEALDDGDVIEPKEVVLRIRARYRRFGLYETAVLGTDVAEHRLGDGRPRVRRGRGAAAGHLLRRPPRAPRRDRQPRLRRHRGWLRGGLDAGRRPSGRPATDRDHAPLAGPHLRRHREGRRGLRPRTWGRRCRASSSWTPSATRPRRRSAWRMRSAIGSTASGSTRPQSAAG